jgi:hypothetical protein
MYFISIINLFSNYYYYFYFEMKRYHRLKSWNMILLYKKIKKIMLLLQYYMVYKNLTKINDI